MCFSKEENDILINHLQCKFGIEFKIKRRQDGSGYVIELNKRNEIIKFNELVKPFLNSVPCIHYKINVEERLLQKRRSLLEKYPDKEIKIAPLHVEDNNYSDEDKNTIISLKKSGLKDKKIANVLERSYWGIVDRIRRLRIEGKL